MIQRTALTLLATLVCLLAFQPVHADSPTPTQQQLSDTFIRSAVSIIDYTQAVEGEAPTILATTLLDAALKLTPKNTEAWAMRVELARSTPGTDDDEEALVNYLATGVRDDRASYELIRLRLAKSNTLDAQLRALEQLLDSDAGRAIEPALRSRLAMLASTMGLELLDEKARRKWLIDAARSDPSNAEAAQTLLGLVIELGGDDVRQGTAMVNVVRAMPLDPGPRLQLAALLAQHGAYTTAAQQYQVVATRLSQQPLSLGDYLLWAHCLALSGQDKLALQLINEFEKALNQPPATVEGEPAPEEVEPAPLPLGLLFVRLSILGDDAKAAQPVFDEIVKRLREANAKAEDETAKTESADQLALLAAVYAPDLDQAAQIVTEHAKAQPATAWVNTLAQGWLALRHGDNAKAKELLGQVTEKHSLASAGLALAVGVDAAGKAKLLREVIADLPATSPANLVAGRSLLALDQKPAPTTTGQAVLNLMGKYPQSFWRVDLERSPWLAVRFEINPTRVKAYEPVQAGVTVWNSASFPLAIGESSPIQPSAIVLINAKTSGKPMPPARPIVIDLKRRFSLAAGERMIFNTRMDYHQFGMLRQSNPDRAFVFDAKLIVNPWLNPGGLWVPSGIGKSADVRNMLVQARGTTASAIDTWVEQLGSADSAERLKATRRLAGLSTAINPDVVSGELLTTLRPLLTEQWNKADNATRALILASAVKLDEDGTSYPQLAELAKQSDSKLVWLSLLMNHADTPGSKLLSTAIARQDMPEVSRFAERLRRLLREIEKLKAEAEAQGP